MARSGIRYKSKWFINLEWPKEEVDIVNPSLILQKKKKKSCRGGLWFLNPKVKWIKAQIGQYNKFVERVD